MRMQYDFFCYYGYPHFTLMNMAELAVWRIGGFGVFISNCILSNYIETAKPPIPPQQNRQKTFSEKEQGNRLRGGKAERRKGGKAERMGRDGHATDRGFSEPKNNPTTTQEQAKKNPIHVVV